MKQHHLTLDGFSLELRGEIENVTASYLAYIQAHSAHVRAQIAASIEAFVSLAGPALELKSVDEKEVYALLTEARQVIARRKLRPEVTPLEAKLLSAVAHREQPVSTAALEKVMIISRTTLNNVLSALKGKGYITRELRRTLTGSQMGYWSLTDKAVAYQAAHPATAPAATSASVSRGGLLPPTAPLVASMKARPS